MIVSSEYEKRVWYNQEAAIRLSDANDGPVDGSLFVQSTVIAKKIPMHLGG